MRLAEEPGKDEFGIEEPADLGAEMLAKVSEAEAGAAGEDAGSVPVAGQGDAGAETVPAPLDGMVLEPVSKGALPAKQPFVMRAYRQKELPLRVESVTGEVATLRMSGGGVKQVSQGEAIPGTPLKVVRVERRMQDTKDQAGQTEVSVVEVEDGSSGRRRELVSGLESTAHDPVALVEDAGGKRYVAKAGQKFRGADGSEYVVIDVRPNQMVIENKTAGEVITVPLRGPRG
jgi:type IV pilus biogenesis protein PilP